MRRALLIGGLLLVVLLTLAAVGIRGSMDSFTPPTLVKPNMAEVQGGHVSAFAARVGSNVVLFDTGPDPAGHGIDAMLKSLNASRADVHDIFLTHGHGDHIAGAGLFPQARIWGGTGDVGLAAGSESPEAIAAKVMRLILPSVHVAITQAMDGDGQTSVGPNQLVRGFAMSGHTPGSMGFLYDGVLFLGDSVGVSEGKLTATLGIFDPHPEQTRDAVVRVSQILASTPIDRVCAAHGGCTAPGTGSKELEAFVQGAAGAGNS